MKKNKLFCAAISLCLALSLIIPLASCVYSNEIVPCIDVLNALTEAEIGLPAGKIYSASAGEGEEGYISDSLLNSLFGGDMNTLIDGWLDYAFFLPSGNHPCEFIVILCDTPTTAKDTARLLSRRLNTLRTANKASGNSIDSTTATNAAKKATTDTASKATADNANKLTVDTAAYLENAAVMISRNYVLLIISSDTATLKKKAFGIIG